MILKDAYKQRFDSENLHSGLYDKRSERLYIRFNHGDSIYVYEDVPIRKWTSLKQASSAGEYFNQAIKEEFDYERVNG